MATQRTYKHLTEEQVTSFMTHGYLRLTDCFTREAAAEWTSDVWTRLGFDPRDKATWTRERTNMPSHKSTKVSEFAPKAWAAICELCGGAERVTPASDKWSDALIVNLGSEQHAGEGLRPKELDGWHVDGDFFVHFLDSPEQGLLVIPLWSDVVPNGGGTVICTEGVGEVARWLEGHPEGVGPRMVPRGAETGWKWEGLGFYKEIVRRCQDESFHEMTGQVGDVILLHPLMLHSATRNGKRMPRIITNPAVSLRAPFCFDRKDAQQYSLVELKTLQVLGKERLEGWQIQGQREQLVPERVRVQAQMKEEETRRLKAIRGEQRMKGEVTVQ